MSPHRVGLLVVILMSMHNFLIHMISFAALHIAISCASVVSTAMMSYILERQITLSPYDLNTTLDTLFRLAPAAKSASEYTSTALSFPEPWKVNATSDVLCRYLITCWIANECPVALPAMCLAKACAACQVASPQ